MTRPRITVRRMMITVAVLAILFWAGLIVSRWTIYRSRFMVLRELSLVLRAESLTLDMRLQAIPPADFAAKKQLEASIEDRRRETIKTEILLDRYKKAMKRPWVSVEPDSSVEEKYYP